MILTRDSIIEYLGELTVAPITRTVRDIPSEVALSENDGMPHDCAINCDHLQTVSKGKLGALITKLNARRMIEVQKAVMFALGFK